LIRILHFSIRGIIYYQVFTWGKAFGEHYQWFDDLWRKNEVEWQDGLFQ